MEPIADPGDQGLLLERDADLDILRDALERLSDGHGSTVLVEGPAGIGKTRLLAEAADLAAREPVLVRVARAGQLEREMPYVVARQLLEPLIERAPEEERSRLLAGSAALSLVALGRADPSQGVAVDPFAPIHGLYWLLANLAEAQPVVLVVDDVHWADGQSLRWLDFVARRAFDTDVLLVAGARTGEAEEASGLEALRADVSEVIHPAPLSGLAVGELVAAAFDGSPPEGLADACGSSSGGNPFLLTELLRGLRDYSTAADADDVEGFAPDTVARSVRSRIEHFGEDATELARAIAVLGAAPQLRHVAALAGLDEDRARELCDRLRGAEILAPGHPAEFVHPLVQAAIYHELSEEARSQAHRYAADLLSSMGARAREIAPHLLACAPNGDQWVVEQLRRAALEAISVGSPFAARRYLERALAEPAVDQMEVTYALGGALRAADHPDAPAVLESVAKKAADPELRLKAIAAASLANVDSGNWEAATRGYELLAASLPPDRAEHKLRAEATLFLARVFHSGRHPGRADRLAGIAASTGERTPGERMVRQALSLERSLACEPVDEVAALASCFPPPPWTFLGPVPAAACQVLAWSGKEEIAREACVSGYEGGTHIVQIASYLEVVLSAIDRMAGRLDDSEAEARAGRDIVQDYAPRSLAGLYASSNLLSTLLVRGKLDEADRLAAQWDLSAPFSVTPVFPVMLEVRGTLRLARGALEEGVADLIALGEDLERFGILNPAAVSWRQEVVPALSALDRTREAKGIADVGEERARAFGAPHVIGAMLRARASAEPARRAIATLRESVSLLGKRGPPHELARSALELGAALRRDGQRRESREPLRQALELAHTCGAEGLAARAREELAVAGSRPRSVFRTGVEALTASELRTARMAAEGLSNVEIAQRLFVTRKTVEKHLSNAYTKLEISSRKELPEVLSSSGGARSTTATRAARD